MLSAHSFHFGKSLAENTASLWVSFGLNAKDLLS